MILSKNSKGIDNSFYFSQTDKKAGTGIVTFFERTFVTIT